MFPVRVYRVDADFDDSYESLFDKVQKNGVVIYKDAIAFNNSDSMSVERKLDRGVVVVPTEFNCIPYGYWGFNVESLLIRKLESKYITGIYRENNYGPVEHDNDNGHITAISYDKQFIMSLDKYDFKHAKTLNNRDFCKLVDNFSYIEDGEVYSNHFDKILGQVASIPGFTIDIYIMAIKITNKDFSKYLYTEHRKIYNFDNLVNDITDVIKIIIENKHIITNVCSKCESKLNAHIKLRKWSDIVGISVNNRFNKHKDVEHKDIKDAKDVEHKDAEDAEDIKDTPIPIVSDDDCYDDDIAEYYDSNSAKSDNEIKNIIDGLDMMELILNN